MDNDLNATFEACNNFNKKLKDTIKVEANMKILKKWELAMYEMYSWTKLHLSWSQSIWKALPANSKTTII